MNYNRIQDKVCLLKYSGNLSLDVDELFSNFSDFMREIKSSSVLIKPNLWYPYPSGSGCITDVRLIKETARCMLEAGAAEVIVGEGAAIGYAFTYSHTTFDVFKAAGLEEAIKGLPVKLVDLNNDRMVEIENPNYLAFEKIRVASTAVNCDYLINMPVLKTHIRTRVTLSMKNLKGALHPDDKKKCHQLGLDEGIADLNSILKSDFVIIDALRGMEGVWDQEHDMVEMNLLLGARNPLTADSLGSALMGIDPDRVRHLSLAKDRHLFEDEEIGEEVIPSSYVRKFSEAGDVLRQRFPNTVINISEACTGCYGSITAPLYKKYSQGKSSDLDNVAIVSGHALSRESINMLLNDRKRVLLIGKCSIADEKTGDNVVVVKGCPPSSEDIIEAFDSL